MPRPGNPPWQRDSKGFKTVKASSCYAVVLVPLLAVGSMMWVTGPTRGQGPSPAQDQDCLARAKAFEAARDFASAADCYASFLKQHPDRADIFQRQGLVYYLSNRFSEAAGAFERALRLDPSLWPAELFLGESEYRTGQYGKALVSLQKVLKVKPDLPEAHFWLGSTLLALGKSEDAAGELEKVPKDSSEAMDAYYLLTQAYHKTAEFYYAQIAKENSDSYRVHQLAGESLAWEGKYQKAILEYRKALRLKPDLEGAHTRIAEMYREQGSFDLAEREYEAELQTYPLDEEARVRVGEYLLAQHRVAEAIPQLEWAFRIDKNSWEACRSLGQAWLESGDPAKAETWLQAAIKINPSDPLSHNLLAAVYRATSRSDLAETESEISRKLSEGK